MSRESKIWTAVMLVGLIALVGRAGFTNPGMGKAYVQVTQGPNGTVQVEAVLDRDDRPEREGVVSMEDRVEDAIGLSHSFFGQCLLELTRSDGGESDRRRPLFSSIPRSPSPFANPSR